MEIYNIEKLTFNYNLNKKTVLKDISMSVNEGEFVLLCGPSGCGKTTLLRHLKQLIAPVGQKSGTIYFKGNDISTISTLELTEKIGFVFQNPDNQIVCDTPLTELAFGLENIGTPPGEINLKIAEMAGYFGITKYLHQDVNTLSGGQKQLLNLASVMAMNPDVLILDEPSSMLDPISSNEFISILEKLNKELGLTIIICEHNLDNLYSLADRVCYMEKGEIIYFDTPPKVAKYIFDTNSKMKYALPVSIGLYGELTDSVSADDIPMTIKDARKYLSSYLEHVSVKTSDTSDISEEKEKIAKKDTALKVKNLFFRYNKTDDDIIKGLNLTVKKGEFLTIHGDNGSGKTTFLLTIAGINKTYLGKIACNKLAYLPQNQFSVFVMDKISDDINYMLKENKIDKERINYLIEKYAFFENIDEFFDKNPLDISSGEQQKLALFKLLLLSPEVLLLDEPTKGLDAFAKYNLAKILIELKNAGITIIMVTHDLEFAANYADKCAMFFNGTIVSKEEPALFFAKNNFYTTNISRITKNIFENISTLNELTTLIK